MRKSKKNIYPTIFLSFAIPFMGSAYPIQYYYYPNTRHKKRTKKRIQDFDYTYADSFHPSKMFKTPKKLVFSQNDDIYKFTKNILDLYNIDYNPSFVDFSLNNFKSKIQEYLGYYRNDNLYINSVNNIRKSSDLLELEKVLNEHEIYTTRGI